MGTAAMIPYIVAVIMELTGGKVFDAWHARGATISQLRRTGMGIAMIGTAVFIYLTMQATTAAQAVFILAHLWVSLHLERQTYGLYPVI